MQHKERAVTPHSTSSCVAIRGAKAPIQLKINITTHMVCYACTSVHLMSNDICENIHIKRV